MNLKNGSARDSKNEFSELWQKSPNSRPTITGLGSITTCGLVDIDKLEAELDQIQANWPAPARRPSVTKYVKRWRSTIKRIPEIPEEHVANADDDSEEQARLRYIDDNVVGKDTCFKGLFGERQGKYYAACIIIRKNGRI